MSELEAHRRGVEVAQARGDVRSRSDIEAQGERRDELQVGLGDAVKLGRQLGGTRGRPSERIELHGQVAVLPDCIDEGGRARNLAKVDGIRGNGGGRVAASAKLLGEAEELAPGFVDRRRVATVRLENFGDVAVVEHARYGGAGHVGKSNLSQASFRAQPQSRDRPSLLASGALRLRSE